MNDRGWIQTIHVIRCACGYEETLETYGSRNVSEYAKRNGWMWDVELGWRCPHHDIVQLKDDDA